MPEKNEKPSSQTYNFSMTPAQMGNFIVKTAIISFTVSALTQPLKSILTQMQLTNNNFLNRRFIFSGTLYKGFLCQVSAGQKRGLFSVSSKELGKTEEHNEVQNYQILGTAALSFTEVGISNAATNKGNLINAGLIGYNFPKSFNNFWKLTTVNLGARSISSFINFAAIGFVGDRITSHFHFKNDYSNQLAGGATSGMVATTISTPFSLYGDRKTLYSKVDKGQLVTQSFFNMMKKTKAYINTVGVKQSLSNFFVSCYLRELVIRYPNSALTFSIIFYMNDLLTPKKNNQEQKPAEPTCLSPLKP